MIKKRYKLAQGGAIGGFQTAGEGLNQIGESLGKINTGLTGNGGVNLPGALGGGGGAVGEIYKNGGVSPPALDQSGTGLFPASSNMKSLGFKKGGKVSSASGRGDGIVQRGKTRGKMC